MRILLKLLEFEVKNCFYRHSNAFCGSVSLTKLKPY